MAFAKVGVFALIMLDLLRGGAATAIAAAADDDDDGNDNEDNEGLLPAFFLALDS